MRYNRCTNEELVQLLHQRTGYACRSHSRATCLRKLKQLDRDVTFRFLDLAAELRNAVYEKVLYYNNETKAVKYFSGKSSQNCYYTPVPASNAFPAILRVSRRINGEARSILYGQSFLTMAVQYLDYGQGLPRNYHIFGGTATNLPNDYLRPLHEFRNLTLILDEHDAPEDGVLWQRSQEPSSPFLTKRML